MPTDTQSAYRFGSFELSDVAHTLKGDSGVIDLAPKEFATLLLLVKRAGHVVEKDSFIKEVWEGAFVGDGSLARTISVLRKHIGADAIETVPRLGYRFALPVTDIQPPASQPAFASPEPAPVVNSAPARRTRN